MKPTKYRFEGPDPLFFISPLLLKPKWHASCICLHRVFEGRFINTDAEMKKLVLVEKTHLIRLGLHKLLSNLSSEWETVSLDVNDIHELPESDRRADLVVLGLPLDPSEGSEMATTLDQVLHPTNMLVLSEHSASWSPLECGAGSVYACIDKKASAGALIAAVQIGMSCRKERIDHKDKADKAAALGHPFLSDKESTCDSTCYAQKSVRSIQELDDLAVAPTPDKPAQAIAPDSPSTHLDPSDQPGSGDAELLNVTPRQYEVLRLLARGYPVKTVARMMHIATATAKAHTASLYRQLKVNSRGEAVYAARQKGALLN